MTVRYADLKDLTRTIRVGRQLFLPDCYVNAPLPDNAPIDPLSDAVVAEIRKTTDANRLGINTVQWTAQPIVVPANQPLVPVLHRTSPTSALGKVMATGFPIPSGWKPTSDGDAHGIFYQPDWRAPDGRFAGRYWELYAAKVEDPATNGGFKYSASHGGRMCDVERNRGFFDAIPAYLPASCAYLPATPEDRNSTYSESNWGGTATSIPLIAGMILKEDVLNDDFGHVVGLAVSEASRTTRQPAQRGDGYAATGNPIQEGMRLRLPAGSLPTSPYPFVQKLERTVARYGFVIWDKSSGFVTMRGEPGLSLGSSDPTWQQLATFPWSKLQVVA